MKDVMNKKIPIWWIEKDKFRENMKVEQSYSQRCLDPNGEFKQNAETEQATSYKSLENSLKPMLDDKACKDDELVKHMSNLPGFLQQMGKQNNIQEKALNFGVLDWKRLEKWKYNERMPTKDQKKIPSSSIGSVCAASGPPKMTTYLRKQPSPDCLNQSSPGKQTCLPIGSSQGNSLIQNSHSISSKMRTREVCCKEENYFGGVKCSERKETLSKEFQPFRGHTITCQQNFPHQSCSDTNVKIKRNETKKDVLSVRKSSSLQHGKQNFSLSSNDKSNVEARKSENGSNDVVDYTSNDCPVELQTVLVTPNQFPMISCSGSSHFAESRKSFEKQLPKTTGNRTPSDIPGSYHVKPIVEQCNFMTSQAMGVDNLRSTFSKSSSVVPLPSDAKHSISREGINRHSFSIEVPKVSDADAGKQPIVKGRHPSPTRFSFGLGKMTRSLSFKERSSVPQLSSTYCSVRSGPIKEISADNSHIDKASSNSKGRSSPLRRLLDPLLKYKSSQSAIVRPPNAASHSTTSKTIPIYGSSPDGVSMGLPSQVLKPSLDKNSMGLCSQGLLQLTLNNGLPSFKVVVDNNRGAMLAAVVKRLPSFGKSDHSMVYTFYSVHETRKKSTIWMQGAKNKSCGLGFTIMGQMIISTSYLPNLNTKASNQCAVRECILYGVDREQVEKQGPEFFPDKEMVAIIIKNSSRRSNDGDSSYNKKSFKEQGSPRFASRALPDMEEDEYSDRAVVILPGGVHGNPRKGVHSSLISRWRSGGSCDCGGWDIGCKLRVLTNQIKRRSKIFEESIPSSTLDSVNLFVQGGDQKSKSVFNLEAIGNGLHSLDLLDSSMSLLEAFATSVALITCEKFPEILDMNIPKHIQEAVSDKMKNTTTLQGKVPVRYGAILPPSPVGRI